MRIRKIEVNFGKGKTIVDFRGESDMPMPLIGIAGKNGSGKSILQLVALRLFSSTAQEKDQIRVFDETIDAVCEFEVDNKIEVGVIRKGVIVQKPGSNKMQVKDNRVINGCLFYDTSLISSSLRTGESYSKHMMSIILQDFYNREVKDCVVFIDNYDLGLDSDNHTLFVQSLIKKTLERDNQLIVTCIDRTRLNMFPSHNVIELSGGYKYFDDFKDFGSVKK
jgi:ABC-type cobalamin/Fe3+-siderophores transport system ATPase subunit